MACARFIITGKVQGVFFRASTRHAAVRLGIAGSAVNRADGSVVVTVSGTLAALAELEQWLQHGPPGARVDNVLREDLPDQELHGFVSG